MITPAAFDDDAAIADLLALAIGGGGSQQVADVRACYRENPAWQLLAATIDGQYVGVSGLSVGRSAVTLRHIAAAAHCRRTGVGTALLAAVFVHAPPDRPVIAETDRDAVGFYRANGFVVASLGEKYPGTERFAARLD